MLLIDFAMLLLMHLEFMDFLDLSFPLFPMLQCSEKCENSQGILLRFSYQGNFYSLQVMKYTPHNEFSNLFGPPCTNLYECACHYNFSFSEMEENLQIMESQILHFALVVTMLLDLKLDKNQN